MIIKDNKIRTRLCCIINVSCLSHVFCTTENNIKYALGKNKVLMKTHIGTRFFSSLSTFKVRFTLPGSRKITFKRQTITCVFRGSTYFSEMTFIYLQGTMSFRTITYQQPGLKKIFNNPWKFSERSIFDLNNLRSFISQTTVHALLRPLYIYDIEEVNLFTLVNTLNE